MKALMILVSATCAALACSKEKAKATDGTASLVSVAYSSVRVGEHHLILVPTAKSPTSLYVLDRGEAPLPDLDLPAPIERVEVEQEGRDLVLIGGGKPMVRFSVRSDVEHVNGELVVPLVGLSTVQDPAGFNIELLSSGSDDNAFKRVNRARLSDPGQAKSDPVRGGGKNPGNGLCCSGGEGSTSCSSHGQTYSCSVTCASGYYACCDRIGIECACKKN